MPEQPSLTISHLNSGLFADHYLNDIMPTQAEWNSIELFNDAKAAFESLRTLRDSINPETLDESQLEEQWIKPILKTLGLYYSVQVKIRYRESGNRRPDYLFVKSEEEARALTSEIYTPDQINHALAVGDAKRWGVNLDQSNKGLRNPAQQIDEYLRYSELSWGILTDGKIWRLYHRDTSKYNRYYAVDLDALLFNESVESFLFFYAFFRREAFTTGWLDRVLASSEEFAQKLSDKLEDEVYEALEYIAQGFLDYRRNRLQPTPEALKEIYENSLVLLYRLLFIFYAESRAILPIEDREYKLRLSMDSIKKEAANELSFNKTFDEDSGHFYNRLRDLFFAIDAGNDRYKVPPYNGRLFSEKEHPFLDKHLVGDKHLVPALDKLARVDDSTLNKRVWVDYRDLEVRHLGSIYEKLLEYGLNVAQEPLIIQNGQYVPAKDGDTPIKQAGEVYLTTGSNERKVTGSYYTPDYIVRFIVEKTLEPLLMEITLKYADLDDDGQWHVREEAPLVQDILDINVLDPATGSGHFVVDVTSYIAEWLRSLGLQPDDLGGEDELIYWKRQVASACIYAIDINPLAVELAKLSMWLTTLAKGKPLSFLDHHIRVGNSLVGTNITDLTDDLGEETRRKKRKKAEEKAAAAGQLSMFSDADFTAGVRFAVEQMTAIENTVAKHVSDVKQQEAMYAELIKRLSHWRQAAHVWTARAFGLALDDAQWKAVWKFTSSGMVPKNVQTIVDEAEKIAVEQRFFHWQLAFPEVFFDANGGLKEDAGFDAVVGNPPYVRYQNFSLPLKNYLASKYEVASSAADLYLYFFELGLNALRINSRLGYVTSGTYMSSSSGRSFRKYIAQKSSIEYVANFGENQPFKGAEMVYPTIAIMRLGEPKPTFNSLFMDGNIPYSNLPETLEKGNWVDTLSDTVHLDEWRFQAVELTRLFRKVSEKLKTVEDIVNTHIYYGLLTGLNKAFMIDQKTRDDIVKKDPKSVEIIQPVLNGKDIRPWFYNNDGQYLILSRIGTDIENYPGVLSYLEGFKAELSKRSMVTGGESKWYELRSCDYYEEFAKPKIVWADIAKIPRFTWDNQNHYVSNTAFFMTNVDWYLLSILQSRVAWFALSQYATPLRLRGGLWQYRVILQFVKRLPIPELTAQQESDLAEIAQAITQQAKERYQVHEDMRQTILNEFGSGEISTRVALYRWWEFENETSLSDEIQNRFGQEIPLKKRSEWRSFLAEQKAAHQRLTDAIIQQETRMNAIVYEAFNLDADEIHLIETTTKYPYGEV